MSPANYLVVILILFVISKRSPLCHLYMYKKEFHTNGAYSGSYTVVSLISVVKIIFVWFPTDENYMILDKYYIEKFLR